MGKAEIVHRMAEKTDLTHTKAQEVVEAILHEIKNALRRGHSAILRRGCDRLPAVRLTDDPVPIYCGA